MKNNNRYLYRALRIEEIEAGYVLIPKSNGPFRAGPRLGIDTRLPFILGPTTENAVRQHQWGQKGFPTSGVSTTPHYHRAEFYAQKHRIVLRIDRSLLEQYGIAEFEVREYLKTYSKDIAVPEDDEIIIVKNDGSMFPQEIIDRVIKI
jgi:hypothetical protein